jgi:hypothetical protein
MADCSFAFMFPMLNWFDVYSRAYKKIFRTWFSFSRFVFRSFRTIYFRWGGIAHFAHVEALYLASDYVVLEEESV